MEWGDGQIKGGVGSDVDAKEVCWGRESWAGNQISQFTGQFTFQLSCYKLLVETERMRLGIQTAEFTFICRAAVLSFRIGWGPRKRTVSPPCQEGPVEIGLGICSGCLPDVSPGKCLGHAHPMRHQSSGQAGEIISCGWIGNVLLSLRGVGGSGRGEECLDLPSQTVPSSTPR